MNRFVLVLYALLSVTSCSPNKGVASGSQSVTFQPWLLGLTAVVGFLFIVFAILIIRRLLRKNRQDEEGWGYDNNAAEMDGGDTKQTSL